MRYTALSKMLSEADKSSTSNWPSWRTGGRCLSQRPCLYWRLISPALCSFSRGHATTLVSGVALSYLCWAAYCMKSSDKDYHPIWHADKGRLQCIYTHLSPTAPVRWKLPMAIRLASPRARSTRTHTHQRKTAFHRNEDTVLVCAETSAEMYISARMGAP